MQRIQKNRPTPYLDESTGIMKVSIYGQKKSLGRRTSPEYLQRLEEADRLWVEETERRRLANLDERAQQQQSLQSPPKLASRSILTLREIEESGRCTIRELAYVFRQDYLKSRHGVGNRELEQIMQAMGYACAAFSEGGDLNVEVFTLGCLEEVRDLIVSAIAESNGGVTVKHINRLVQKIVRVFSWGRRKGIVSAEVAQRLKDIDTLAETSAALYSANSKLKPAGTVNAVPDGLLRATIEHPECPKILAHMIRLQVLTGCRPQDVTIMRGAAIDRSDPSCWLYWPSKLIEGKTIAHHKNAHKMKKREFPEAKNDRHRRVIPITEKAQHILYPYLEQLPDQEQYLFSARREWKRFQQERSATRKSKPHHGNRTKGDTAFADDDFDYPYSTTSYGKKLSRFLKKAALDHWAPNQIRHKTATDLFRVEAMKMSSVLLGHQGTEVTKNYARIDIDGLKEAALIAESNTALE